jgi:hypothetical protein
VATSATVFKVPFFPEKRYKVEVKYRLVIPDNMKHWQVFEYDKQIESFLGMENEFENLNIDECYDDEAIFTKEGYFDNQITGRDIVQLKRNVISKGLVPLEKLFDNNDVARSPKITVDEEDMEDCNIGTPKDPKIIKLSKKLSPKVKERYVKLIKEFPDVFSWSYDDLKFYDTSIIQHVILIKEDHKPFKQKLRRINPLLLPLIEKEVKKLFEAKIIVSLRFSKWVENLVGQLRGGGGESVVTVLKQLCFF